MASFELLERLRTSSYRERTEVVEHKPATELVTPVDIVRSDGLGRQVVACPAGQPPSSWLKLTDRERAALVEPPPRPPAGYLHPGPFGFTPEGVVVGGYLIDNGGYVD